jgi:uncharacterized protein YwlG (UPF0340 family)
MKEAELLAVFESIKEKYRVSEQSSSVVTSIIKGVSKQQEFKMDNLTLGLSTEKVLGTEVGIVIAYEYEGTISLFIVHNNGSITAKNENGEVLYKLSSIEAEVSKPYLAESLLTLHECQYDPYI